MPEPLWYVEGIYKIKSGVVKFCERCGNELKNTFINLVSEDENDSLHVHAGCC